MSAGPYIAVCGKCNVALDKHPVEQCPYEYQPISHDGRVYGYRMLDKKNGTSQEKEDKARAP